jgi:hypothetical protein
MQSENSKKASAVGEQGTWRLLEGTGKFSRDQIALKFEGIMETWQINGKAHTDTLL